MSFLTRHWKGIAKVVGGVLGLVLASFVVPAISRQWSDQEAALRLKADLFTDLSSLSSETFAEALRIPATARFKEALSLRRELRERWIAGRSGIQARYAVYFAGTAAERHWRAYNQAMFDWLLLGCCAWDHQARSDALMRVGDYLRNYPLPKASPRRPPEEPESGQPSEVPGRPWRILSCAPHEPCAVRVRPPRPWRLRLCQPREPCSGRLRGGPDFGGPDLSGFYRRVAVDDKRFVLSYQWLGDQLLRRRNVLLAKLRATNAEGLSDTYEDFLNNIVQPISG
jgi:hypothetical protein